MNELILKYRDKFTNYWSQLNKGQKTKIILIIGFLFASLILFTVLTTRTKYEPTFMNLDQKTAGKIVAKLDDMGVSYQLSSDGSTIFVPEAMASKVKVTIAQEDLGSGVIFNKFWDNSQFGVTDSTFRVLERGAIEEELKGLIVNIEGISDAYVMITLPEEKVFAYENDQKATASVLVNVEPGVDLSPNQIKSIFNLISRSVPNLPIENITLSDQYGEPFEYTAIHNTSQIDAYTYNQQHQIQKEFQQDLKKDIETMLKGMMGPANVKVNVFASMDFDQKRTQEKLVQPVVDGKGLARSIETIQESFQGSGNAAGGIPGTGDTQIPGYQSGDSQNGNYEHLEERVNYDVNEITKEIISSPYSLRDLSIMVAVNMPEASAANTIDAIKSIITPIVSTAIEDKTINVADKIAVVAHPFEEGASLFPEKSNGIDPMMLLYGAIGLSVLAIGGFGFGIARRNRRRRELEEQEMLMDEDKGPQFDFSPPLSEEMVLQREIQKLSYSKPSDFVKLLRTWLNED